jgi:hypothetical protein
MAFENGNVLFDFKKHTIGFAIEMPMNETLREIYSSGVRNKLEYANTCLVNLDPNAENYKTKALCLKEFVKTKSRSKKNPSFYATFNSVLQPSYRKA